MLWILAVYLNCVCSVQLGGERPIEYDEPGDPIS
jgi:hypothetical protein